MRSAGHALERYVIHEAAREPRDFRDARLGRRRGEEEDGREAVRVHHGRKVARLFGRIVDDEHAVDTGVLRTFSERFQAHRLDGIRVSHEHHRRRRVPAPELRNDVEHVRERDVLRERALGGTLDHRAVGHRIGERHAKLEYVGARRHQRLHDRQRRRERWIARRDIGNQRGTPGLAQPRKRCIDAIQGFAFRASRSATVAMSLSPRPERLTSRIRSFAERGGELFCVGERVRRLERGDDPLDAAALVESLQRFLVVDHDVFRAPGVLEPRVLGADARIVEAGRHGVRLDDLPVRILQEVGAVAVQHAGSPAGERGRMTAGCETVAAGFDADQAHAWNRDVRIEDAHRVAAAADARDDRVRMTARVLWHLRHAFVADHALEIAHHHRVRMRSRDGADDVEGVLDVRHPVAHRFVERVLERLAARLDGHDLGAEQVHAVDVLRLALHVLRAHVDDAFHAVARGDGRGGDAVLARARLGDHARLAHALGKQRLADHVVDLVRAGVIEVLALEPDLRAAELARPALGVVDGRRPADVVLQLARELGAERGIVAIARVRRLQLVERAHRAFRRRTRRRTVRSARARRASSRKSRWEDQSSAWRTPLMNAAMREASFNPRRALPSGPTLFHAARDIDGPRAHCANRGLDVAADRARRRGSPARAALRARRRESRPVERTAGAAGKIARPVRIEHEAGRVLVQSRVF